MYAVIEDQCQVTLPWVLFIVVVRLQCQYRMVAVGIASSCWSVTMYCRTRWPSMRQWNSSVAHTNTKAPTRTPTVKCCLAMHRSGSTLTPSGSYCVLYIVFKQSSLFSGGNSCLQCFNTWFPSMLWDCWLGIRKGIHPVKRWVLVCWWWWFDWSLHVLHLQLSPPPPSSTLAQIKSRLETFLYWLTQVCVENGC